MSSHGSHVYTPVFIQLPASPPLLTSDTQTEGVHVRPGGGLRGDRSARLCVFQTLVHLGIWGCGDQHFFHSLVVLSKIGNAPSGAFIYFIRTCQAFFLTEGRGPVTQLERC